MQLTMILYALLRVWVGAYFMYWGFNGFFQWSAVPVNSPAFESFIKRLNEIPHLMTAVKVTEIVCGFALLSGLAFEVGLFGLLPIVLVIAGSHLYLNFTLGWRVALTVLLPYLALAIAS